MNTGNQREKKFNDLIKAAEPLKKFMEEHYHFHCSAIVTFDNVKIVETSLYAPLLQRAEKRKKSIKTHTKEAKFKISKRGVKSMTAEEFRKQKELESKRLNDFSIGYLTPTELAERLKVSTRTIMRKIASGEIEAFKFGKYWRIPEKQNM